MMTLSDEEANRLNNSIKSKFSAPDEAKQILTAWYFDGAKIQYAGKTNPTEDDWNDYTKSEFPTKNTFIQYKWRLKPEETPVKKCRVALFKFNDIIKPLLVMDYKHSLDLRCNEQFIKWLTDWICIDEDEQLSTKNDKVQRDYILGSNKSKAF